MSTQSERGRQPVSMDHRRINEIVALIEGRLSPAERKGFFRELLDDPESAELVQLMLLPELRAENNFPPPFPIAGTRLFGVDEGYLLGISADPETDGDRTAALRGLLEGIFAEGFPGPISRTIDLALPGDRDSHSLSVGLAQNPSDSRIALSVSCAKKMEGTVEIWRQGSLVLKTPSTSLPVGPVFHLGLGESVVVRHSSADHGLEVLCSETDFSPIEWKSALVCSCMSGRVPEGIEILRKRLVPLESFGALRKILHRLSAMASVCKFEDLAILPTPSTRSSTRDKEDLIEAYGLVWNGLVASRPEVRSLENPWKEDPGGNGDTSGAGGELNEDVEALAQAILDAANGSPPPEAQPQAASDADIRMGWVALYGWRAMLQRDYARAWSEFLNVETTLDDPFGLEFGKTLASHHQGVSGREGSGAPSDMDHQVWEAAFRGLF